MAERALQWLLDLAYLIYWNTFVFPFRIKQTCVTQEPLCDTKDN